MLLFVIVVALLAPILAPYDPNEISPNLRQAPSLAHPFGTDELGRDIFTRTIYGLRTDLLLVLLAVPVSGIIGSLLGLSGSVFPRFGTLMQRVFDIIIGFPSFILALCVVVVLGKNFTSTVIAITLLGLPGFGRLARSGSSLRVDSACMAQKPPTQNSVSTASAPPVMTAAHCPLAINAALSPMACAPDAQADVKV